MSDVIYARRDRYGEYIYNPEHDAWEFEDRMTGDTWWVTDRAMNACIGDRCKAFQQEGHGENEARKLAHEEAHGGSWGMDEWESIRGVYREDDEAENDRRKLRFRGGRGGDLL